jgi:hypothetical protein
MQSDRRQFLQASLLGAAAAALPVDPATAATGAESKATSKAEPFELDELTIDDLQQAMKSGQETARSLVKKYQLRIEAVDQKGPALNSVIEFNPDALEIAEALDKERKAKGPRGPLHPHAHHRGLVGAYGRPASRGCVSRSALARGRCRHLGEDQSQRVGQHPLQLLHQRLERPRRTDVPSQSAPRPTDRSSPRLRPTASWE